MFIIYRCGNAMDAALVGAVDGGRAFCLLDSGDLAEVDRLSLGLTAADISSFYLEAEISQ